MVTVPRNIDCCNLVGNFPDPPASWGNLISISSKGNTNVTLVGDTTTIGGALLTEPHLGSITMTFYASLNKHYGCPGRANVTINWIKKSDCDSYVFLYGGAGKSTISGDVDNYVEFPSLNGDVNNPVSVTKYVDANASSGPDKQYRFETQYDGYGLIYKGSPFTIDTTVENDCIFDLSWLLGGFGYLQSLTFQCTPNNLPTLSLDLIYTTESYYG